MEGKSSNAVPEVSGKTQQRIASQKREWEPQVQTQGTSPGKMTILGGGRDMAWSIKARNKKKHKQTKERIKKKEEFYQISRRNSQQNNQKGTQCVRGGSGEGRFVQQNSWSYETTRKREGGWKSPRQPHFVGEALRYNQADSLARGGGLYFSHLPQREASLQESLHKREDCRVSMRRGFKRRSEASELDGKQRESRGHRWRFIKWGGDKAKVGGKNTKQADSGNLHRTGGNNEKKRKNPIKEKFSES